jgi:hypothetical protein
MSALPAVAKSFYTFCKKCNTDRYHMVQNHPTPSSAKMKCEVCGKVQTWKPPKTASQKAAIKKEGVQRKARNTHKDQWELFLQNHGSAPEVEYNTKKKFEPNSVVKHPKFGRGFVKEVMTDKIEVLFEDEVKLLMHNRQ